VKDNDFSELVHEHYDRLFRAASFMCGSEQAAEDLVQETFLAAAESIKRFEGRSSTYTWLYGIMLNKFRRWLRRKVTAPVSLQESGEGEQGRGLEDLLRADGPLPGEAAEQAETARLVRAALEHLSGDHRAVISMRYVDGMSYHEIAEVLGCPLGTVKSRIHYALESIARKLSYMEPPEQ
jgi:RNA polymerase sigma-70 factor (ECF subfamily)